MSQDLGDAGFTIVPFGQSFKDACTAFLAIAGMEVYILRQIVFY